VSYWGADKSLAQPGRKQTTATKPLTFEKNSEGCPSNQVSMASMTSALDEKRATFQMFFQSGQAKDLSPPL